MASKKMCKSAHETVNCGASQTVAVATLGACGAHAPEKKHHFWQRNKSEQAINKHHELGIRQFYGHGSNTPIGGFVHHEGGEISVVCIEMKEERVSIIHVKNKSRVKGKCAQ